MKQLSTISLQVHLSNHFKNTATWKVVELTASGELTQKQWSRISHDPLIQKIDDYGTTDSYPGARFSKNLRKNPKFSL